jgi:phosphoserine phosphatase RsbU/P
VVTAFQPAREVSGDFYDIFTLPDGKLVMVICDVSGKDVSAALFMALIRTLIRSLAEQAIVRNTQPLDAIGQANRYLINHHYGNNGRYMYATLFMAVLDPASGAVRYVNAGHNPVALMAKSGELRMWLGTTGPAVGIIPEAEFASKTLEMTAGDLLFMYTDGVTEARSPAGELFSKARLLDLLSQPVTTGSELLTRIEDAVTAFTGGGAPFDDITMLVLRRDTLA